MNGNNISLFSQKRQTRGKTSPVRPKWYQDWIANTGGVATAGGAGRGTTGRGTAGANVAVPTARAGERFGVNWQQLKKLGLIGAEPQEIDFSAVSTEPDVQKYINLLKANMPQYGEPGWGTIEERMYVPAQRQVQEEMKKGLAGLETGGMAAGYGGRASFEDKAKAALLSTGAQNVGALRSAAALQTETMRQTWQKQQQGTALAIAQLASNLGVSKMEASQKLVSLRIQNEANKKNYRLAVMGIAERLGINEAQAEQRLNEMFYQEQLLRTRPLLPSELGSMLANIAASYNPQYGRPAGGIGLTPPTGW